MSEETIKSIYTDSPCLTAEEVIGYKNGILTGEKTRRVELHLASCKLCSEALAGMEYIADDRFKTLVNQINSEVNVKVAGKFFFSNRAFVYSIAASILIIISSIFYFTGNSKDENIFDKYFEAYPNITSISRGNESYSQLQSVMILYSSGDFKSFLEKSRSIISTFPNDTLKFYRGVAFLASDEIEKGIQSLSSLANVKNGFYNEANWYTALGYIKIDEGKKAVQYLNKIKDASDYSGKIKLLLNEIESDE